MIIGLCGPAGAGKNTVADILVEDYGFQAISFADPIYRAVSEITGLPVSHLQDRRYKEKPIGWLGSSPRELLQTLGTEWGRKMIHENMWIVVLLNKIGEIKEQGGDVVVTDVRFDNEATALTLAGGDIWQVVRPGVADVAEHESENGISPELVDVVINNDSSVAYLRERVVREMEFAANVE